MRAPTPVVDVRNFLLATRDSGYRSTAAAVAELVDNSVQAGAGQVQIDVLEDRSSGERELILLVQDNGRGMPRTLLATALQFGGSDRFGDRRGFGRFGMGLPNSSLSQCRRVEVYSWQSKGKVFTSHLDLDELLRSETPGLPEARPCLLPPESRHAPARTGTLVVWRRCDRLDNRKAATIARKLLRPLGQRFRYFLWSGGRIQVNGDLVAPVDPLFCANDSVLSGASPACPTLTYDVKVPGKVDRSSTIRVAFSRLPIAAWHAWPLDTKRRLGIVGGAGVSVVRAAREIDYGWYFLGEKRRQNYDDWWRCEVAFEPELDELFGVTHSKQEVNPTPELEQILTQDISAVARSLSVAVRDEFARIGQAEAAAAVESSSARRAGDREWRLLPPTPATAAVSEAVPARRLGYRLSVRATGEPTFFDWKLVDGDLALEINSDHPFHREVLAPASKSRSVRLEHLELLLLAAARAEASGIVPPQYMSEGRVAWSNVLAAFLGR